jgi:hypothetical protein
MQSSFSIDRLPFPTVVYSSHKHDICHANTLFYNTFCRSEIRKSFVEGVYLTRTLLKHKICTINLDLMNSSIEENTSEPLTMKEIILRMVEMG